MIDKILSTVFSNQWLVIGITSALLMGMAELGFRFGLRLHHAKDEPRKGQIAGTQGAILGMLALLLGFTLALAASRYEARRGLVLQEANAIGTTYLRAELLPESHQKEVGNLLRQYVDVRLDFYQAGASKPKQAEAERAAARIQSELWKHAVASGKEAPTAMVAAFINALNETIDLDATRMDSLRNHIPGAMWLLVLAMAACGSYANGYGTGASGVRSLFTNVLLPLVIAVAITLIADLDRPRGGLIGINQQPLLDLKQSLQANPGE